MRQMADASFWEEASNVYSSHSILLQFMGYDNYCNFKIKKPFLFIWTLMSLGVWDFLLIQNVQRLKKKKFQILAVSLKECLKYDGSLCEMNHGEFYQ